MTTPPHTWLNGDFNGLFGDLLCLSHGDTVTRADGERIAAVSGTSATAWEPDPDQEGRPDALLASGIVVPSPPELQCLGSRWALRMDHDGVRHASSIYGEDRASWPEELRQLLGIGG